MSQDHKEHKLFYHLQWNILSIRSLQLYNSFSTIYNGVVGYVRLSYLQPSGLLDSQLTISLYSLLHIFSIEFSPPQILTTSRGRRASKICVKYNMFCMWKSLAIPNLGFGLALHLGWVRVDISDLIDECVVFGLSLFLLFDNQLDLN